MSLAVSQLTSLVISTALVLAPFAYPQIAEANPNDLVWRQIAGTEAVSDRLQNAGDQPDATVDPFEAMLADYATSLPTLDELATQFGTDPEAAFSFVRDQIRTEPYAGSLRSPASVVAASGGNLQDKSELLMVLLRKMGHDARLAQTPMTDAIAERLRGETCAIPLTADNNIPALLSLTPAATQRAIARAQRDYGLLLDASLDDIDASSAFSTNFGSTYFWVQYRSPEGWKDLDPALRSMAAGETFTQPSALSEGGENPHVVTIAVVTETLSNGKLREKTVLSHEVAARDAYEMPIQLGFIPAGAGLGGLLADQLGDAIDLAPRLKPVLFLNWDAKIGSDFAQPGPSASGGLSDAQDEDPVTAVWIDISSIAPEGETRTARRAVIDLLSFDARQSGAITPDAVQQIHKGQRYAEELESSRQIVVSNGGLDPAQVADRNAYIMANLDEIVTKYNDGTIQPESLTWLIWTAVQGIAVGAERATRDLRSGDGTICAFSGHANVMTWGITPKGAEDFITTIDWTIDGIDLASALVTPNPKEAAAMRLWYGAVRSAIETDSLSPEQEGTVRADQGVISASTLLNGPLDRLSPQAVAALGVRSAQSDLDAGYILLGTLHEQTQMPAWWRVDPSSGSTDARLADLGNNSIYGGNYVNAALPGKPYYLPPPGPPTPPVPSTPPPPTAPQKSGGGLEYTLLVIGVALASITAVYFYGRHLEFKIRQAQDAMDQRVHERDMDELNRGPGGIPLGSP